MDTSYSHKNVELILGRQSPAPLSTLSPCELSAIVFGVMIELKFNLKSLPYEGLGKFVQELIGYDAYYVLFGHDKIPEGFTNALVDRRMVVNYRFDTESIGKNQKSENWLLMSDKGELFYFRHDFEVERLTRYPDNLPTKHLYSYLKQWTEPELALNIALDINNWRIYISRLLGRLLEQFQTDRESRLSRMQNMDHGRSNLFQIMRRLDMGY